MFYKVEYQKRAHQEVEKIFRVLFPEQGLAVREEQIRLCHEMLDTLLGEQIALCDAGVGIGKTYAYLVACVLLRKYAVLTGRENSVEQRPVVVSTSSIALQKAILTEYIPFLSRMLLEQGIIQSPLRAVVRKGKEHFVCDNRLEQRIEAIRNKQKNASQKEALISLRKQYDIDTVKDLSGFDRRLVCVPKFLSKRMSEQADVPLSEVFGRSQETGCVHSNL
jgi:ATP-dependent DNA helicase DinG